MVEYAAADAEYALRLHLAQQNDVQRLGLLPHLAAVEWPLVPVVADMEREGLPVDRERLGRYRELCLRLAAVMARRLEAQGIKPGSRNSFLRAMHRAGALTHFVVKDKYSTEEAVLRAAEAAGAHPAVKPFRLHRYFSRLATGELLAGALLSADGRQRCDLDQLRSVSGRIASSRPNLIGLDRRLRPLFAAPPGHVLIELDYSQKEVGVAGAEWHDDGLVRQFNQGDSYAGMAQVFYADRLTAAERALDIRAFGKARPELRKKVKSLVLGILYGRGAPGIAEAFGCSLGHAQAELERFFDLFPQARDQARAAVERSLCRGSGLTATGLRRLVEVGDRRQANALRNHPIQGSAAAIFKKALLLLHGHFAGTPTRLLLPRHDSVLLLTPEETADEVEAACKVLMAQPLRAIYPDLRPTVSHERGRSWPTGQTLEGYQEHETAGDLEAGGPGR
jgi:DNA polymerase-1